MYMLSLPQSTDGWLIKYFAMFFLFNQYVTQSYECHDDI